MESHDLGIVRRMPMTVLRDPRVAILPETARHFVQLPTQKLRYSDG